MIAQLDWAYIKARPWKVYTRLVSYFLFEGRPLTTRGQWINPFVLAWLRLLAALPVWPGVVAPVFIVGTGRSGTTALGMTLSFHRSVGFLNEPKAIWHVAHGGEDLIGTYSRGDARYLLGRADAAPGLVRSVRRIFGAYRVVGLCRRVVDKYPELVFRGEFVRAAFPDARFIFLARNGWDTCRSITHWSQRMGETRDAETHDWWGANDRKWTLLIDQVVALDPELAPHADRIRRFVRHEDRSAVEWILSMKAGMMLAESTPGQVLTLRYEDMVSDPAARIAEVFDFCGLPADAGAIAHAAATLRSAPIGEAVELDDVLVEPFGRMMDRLGYGNT